MTKVGPRVSDPKKKESRPDNKYNDCKKPPLRKGPPKYRNLVVEWILVLCCLIIRYKDPKTEYGNLNPPYSQIICPFYSLREFAMINVSCSPLVGTLIGRCSPVRGSFPGPNK